MTKLIFLLLLFVACKHDPNLAGAYTLVAARYGDSTLSKENIEGHKTVVVFKNGYWVSVNYSGNPQTTVESAVGGTYVLKGGKCIQTINFSSDNTTIIGKTLSFEYELKGSKYFRKGRMTSDNGEYSLEEEYNKIARDKSLQDASLEGVWELKSAKWHGNSYNNHPDFMQFKIYSYPSFAWAQYTVKGKDYIAVGGGSYQYDRKKLVEHLEYCSLGGAIIIPSNVEINVTEISSTEIKQETANGEGKEVWKKTE